MKLELTEGCICDSFTADGKFINTLSEKELKDILKAVVAKITTTKYEDENTVYYLQNILYEIVSRFYDEYESDDEPCECCGDFVETFKMEVFL
jgi:hypothetical protein